MGSQATSITKDANQEDVELVETIPSISPETVKTTQENYQDDSIGVEKKSEGDLEEENKDKGSGKDQDKKESIVEDGTADEKESRGDEQKDQDKIETSETDGEDLVSETGKQNNDDVVTENPQNEASRILDASEEKNDLEVEKEDNTETDESSGQKIDCSGDGKGRNKEIEKMTEPTYNDDNKKQGALEEKEEDKKEEKHIKETLEELEEQRDIESQQASGHKSDEDEENVENNDIVKSQDEVKKENKEAKNGEDLGKEETGSME